MAIVNGSAADATDIEKNIVTYLEGINQTTILSQNATVTDKVYTNGESETFSDATGYNNHVDTGNTTARFLGDRYVLGPGTVYDDFTDNSINLTLWTVTETPGIGTATVTEQNQKMEIDCTITSALGQGALAFIVTDTNYTDYLRWDCDAVSGTFGAGGGWQVSVQIGGTIIVDKENSGLGTYKDYAIGTWEIFKVSTSVHRLYKNNVFVREITSALSGEVKFYAACQDNATDGATVNHDFDDVYLTFASSSYVQTNSKTFAANVQEILLSVNNDITLSGTSMDFDASTDGGTVFEKTDQAFDTIISGLDNDNTGMVLKINLAASGTSTPWIFGYSYQGWVS